MIENEPWSNLVLDRRHTEPHAHNKYDFRRRNLALPRDRWRMLLCRAWFVTICWAHNAAPCGAQETSAAWQETTTLAADEATQAAAADERHVYAIASRSIAKYDRRTGQQLAKSSGSATHLNSGFFWQGKLYCAHSNYPAKPERSELLVLDPESMELTTHHDFADQPGSLTWAVRHDDAWWCNFAYYDADNHKSYLARFDDNWREQARWTYPAKLVERLGRYSLSGGVWYRGQLLATDHDHEVLYQLAVPPAADSGKPGELEFVATIPAPFAGQGIAHDPVTDGLLGVVRKKKLVIFAERGETPRSSAQNEEQPQQSATEKSPVDLVLTPDESRVVTANQSANSLSLVEVATGRVLAEAPCGNRPSNLAITPDGKRVLATASYSGELLFYELSDDRLERVGSLKLGFEPRGVAISPDGLLAYVALSTADVLAVVDIQLREVTDRIAVGRWPRFLALSSDGRRLAVGCNGARGVAVVDTESKQQRYLEEFGGLNLGQMQISADGSQVYFPWITYRRNPITESNIRQGWVLASRIARVRLDGHVRREAISLDPQGKAVGDPHGIALSPDEQTLVCTASGTHELLVFQLPGLPFQDYGGPGDHIDAKLLSESQRFSRIPLGGRPMAVRYSMNGDRVYIVNYLLDAVQVVDMTSRTLARSIELSSAQSPSLARRGEAIFFDAARSLDQWYSCHSCHYEGHTNAVTIDTRNDGRFGNFKTVLSLRGSSQTGPWFWHGWSTDFRGSLRKSMTETMLGPEPTDEDVEAMAAYIKSLSEPPNPFRDDELASAAAARGANVFQSAKAGCTQCHPAPHFTDGQTHDVGLGAATDAYEGFNSPSLRGVYDRVLLLHDGRARSLEALLTGPHNPARVTGQGELTDDERQDLLAYLRSL
jgi:DNA-binding beta-propeller fold protein YncE